MTAKIEYLNCPKLEQLSFTMQCRVQKDADGLENSLNPDQNDITNSVHLFIYGTPILGNLNFQTRREVYLSPFPEFVQWNHVFSVPDRLKI